MGHFYTIPDLHCCTSLECFPSDGLYPCARATWSIGQSTDWYNARLYDVFFLSSFQLAGGIQGPPGEAPAVAGTGTEQQSFGRITSHQAPDGLV
jgi:hypothetical protein